MPHKHKPAAMFQDFSIQIKASSSGVFPKQVLSWAQIYSRTFSLLNNTNTNGHCSANFMFFTFVQTFYF